MAAAAGLDTFPKLLAHNAGLRGGRPAIREKDLGIWQAWTWAEVAREVEMMAAGFAALGLRRDDKILVVGDNRPRLYWTMVAAQAMGAIPVPVYQDAVAREMAFVVEHAEARFAVAEDQEQVDKLLEIQAGDGKLERIVYCDARGLRHYVQPSLTSFEKLEELGRAKLAAEPGWYAAEVAKGKGSDVSIMLYTSGTTGSPKGVVLSFDNVVKAAQAGIDFDKLTEREEVLAYLPMAWVGDHVFSFAESYIAGFCVSCPESGATVMHDLRELGPSFFFAPPRIFENLLTTVMIRMEDASPLKRWLFHRFLGVAERVGPRLLNRQKVALGDRLLYRLGELLVYGPLKNTLGFSRIRLAYTAGEAIGPEIFQFFRSLGINLKQLYGSTEASVFITNQPDDEVRPDTVGRPVPGVELRLSADGEVLFRSPGVFQEYYKNPEATAETKTADGWVHTGDAGLMTQDGHLRIIDRAKDVGRLTSGQLFAPKYLENKLKFFPNIREAVAFGNGRDHVAAFINIDLAAVGSWAERNNVPYGGYLDLASNAEVAAIVRSHIEQVNRDLAADPELSGTQIRRFLILHKELDADDGELTRTRKVRRRIVAEKYLPLIEALYDGSERARIETQVTFEDGRTGVVKADLQVHDAKTFPPAAAQPQLRQAAE
jgi:long-chain acyl-CoA synthetase